MSSMRATDLVLAPLAGLYAGVMRARNLAFDAKLLPSGGPNVPIVSVGNLSAGGTGKTPIVSFLVEEFTKQGLSCGIVSRGYGGETVEPTFVVPDGSRASAKKFGDEPTWLAHKHHKVPVFVGADRKAAAAKLVGEMKVDLIVADDAFQHRYLRRDIDIVLIDTSQPLWHHRSLPMGRMREGFSSLSRARFVFLTKTNLASAEALAWVRRRVAEEKAHSNFDVFEFEWAIQGFAPLDQPEAAPAVLKQARLLLVSGIARGSAFADSVRAMSGGCEVAGHLEFADHHEYSASDLALIEREAEKLGVDAVVVTEKDAVKLSGFWQGKVPCLVSRLQARPTGDLRQVYEEIRRLVR